jgi:hypothetical protein
VYASCFHTSYKTRDRQADVRGFQVLGIIGSFLQGGSLRSKLVALGVTNANFFSGGLERPDSFGSFFEQWLTDKMTFSLSFKTWSFAYEWKI